MRRWILLLLPTVAMTLLPATQARAAGSTAFCFHSWTDTVTPGVSVIPEKSTFTSNGEIWTLTCGGFVRGARVTGPGTFGEHGTLEGTCGQGSGQVHFSFTIPTTDGDQKFAFSFPFYWGPGGGTGNTQTFPGVFMFYPKVGDCFSQKVTEVNIMRWAQLFS
jgi:hypothetical protein